MPTDPRLQRIADGRTDLIADVIATQVDAHSLLQWAAYYGDVSALRLLLASNTNLLQLGPDLGLNGAAFHGHWQLTEFLLEQGAAVNYADPATGETALHSALCHGDRVRYDLVLRVLLQAGADPNAATIAGVPTGAFMRDCRTRGESPLHRAAAFGSPSTVTLLLDAGAVRTQTDAHGDTPLAWASWYRRPVEVLRLLLHGEHWIHPDNKPMRENLLGTPAATIRKPS